MRRATRDRFKRIHLLMTEKELYFLWGGVEQEIGKSLLLGSLPSLEERSFQDHRRLSLELLRRK